MPCFFLPLESFNSPLLSNVGRATTKFSSAIFSSFNFAPPPLMSLRTSLLVLARSNRRNISMTEIPAAASALVILALRSYNRVRGLLTSATVPETQGNIWNGFLSTASQASTAATECILRTYQRGNVYTAGFAFTSEEQRLIRQLRPRISGRQSDVSPINMLPHEASWSLRQRAQSVLQQAHHPTELT